MINKSCSVALPIPTDNLYSYSIPTAMADRVFEGSRVVVSVRSRMHVGIVIECSTTERDDLKPILLAPDQLPLVPSTLVELARWMARYYFTPLGIVLKSMVPGTLWGASRVMVSLTDLPRSRGGGATAKLYDMIRSFERPVAASTLAGKTGRPVWTTLQRLQKDGAVRLETEPPSTGPAPGKKRFVVLKEVPETLIDRQRLLGRAPRQRAAFEAIEAMGGEAPASELAVKHGVTPSVIKALVDKGLALVEQRESLRDPFADLAGTPPASPNEAQRRAMDEIRATGVGSATSLFGVTGSGKTLVYLEAVREEVERGRGAIVLVPEIALTPQTISRVRGVFGNEVAVLHSALSAGERADAWRGLAAGSRRVAVGARSAVFAPIKDLAAIVVDEEHDSSYKNGEAPRYNARDVAVRRAALEGARAILSSATPALETWAARDRIKVVRLPDRVSGNAMPRVTLVDLRKEKSVKGSAALPWSEVLDAAVRQRLDKGEQTILMLNRRGFAHFLQCGACGEVNGCPDCSIALTVHSTPQRLFCHYCGYSEEVTTKCLHCGNEKHIARGVGTQQLERWLSERFPDARTARMDADTTGARWSHHRILDEFGRRGIDILFGTQMIAKGLDFPGVTLVGVIDADTGLNLPDFRAAERTFQLVAQVAGRAGRGDASGEVIVQTRNPDHIAMRAAAAHDFEGFAEQDFEDRKHPGYPPHVGLINVVLSGLREPQVAEAAVKLGDWLRELVHEKMEGAVDILGPAPAPLARIKKRWRWHIVLRASERGLLGRLGSYAAGKSGLLVGRGVRVIFDRDPSSLL